MQVLKDRQSTRGKVLIAFIIGGIALALSWVVSKVAFTRMQQTIERVSAPNEKLVLVNGMFQQISQLENVQRVEAFTEETATPTFSFSQSIRLGKMLDTLMIKTTDEKQLLRIDSMKSVLHARDRLFEDYLRLRSSLVHNEALSNQIQHLSHILSSNSANADTNVVTTEKKTTTITQVMPSDSTESSITEQKKRGLLDKLFGRNKPEEKTNAPKLQTFVREELKIVVDTVTVSKQDSVLGEVDAMITNIDKNQRNKSTQLLKKELEVIRYDNQLAEQLFELLRQVEQEEIRLVNEDTHAAISSVDESISRINMIALVFFLGAGLLVYFIFTDISKSNAYKRQLLIAKEEAERAGMARQYFLANMSHEIRTPLQSIIGFSEQLIDTDMPNKESLHIIHQSSEHLLHIVNDVLDYSRITSGKITFDPHNFSMQRLIDEVAENMRVQAGKKQLLFELNYLHGDHHLFYGDAFRLKQILYNLLGNAIKFTDHGKVSLTVTSKAQKKHTNFTFEIRDTGIGISEAESEKIFHAFEQAGHHITANYGGTGLGLSIARLLVNGMQGHMRMESTEGMGTVFTVMIPFQNTDAEETTKTSLSLNGIRKFRDKVLLVDDDAWILKLCHNILDKYKIQNTSFRSAEEALAMEWDEKIKFVMLDIRMQGMNGLTLCRKLRQRHGNKVKIIALTAQTLPEERQEIYDAGFDDILTKPFREIELLAALVGENMPVETIEVAATEIQEEFHELKKMSGNDKQVLKDIFEQFVNDTEADLESLQKYKGKDTKKLLDPIHRMAGRIGQLGERELAQKLRTVESHITGNTPLPQIISDVRKVEPEIISLKEKVRTYMYTM